LPFPAPLPVELPTVSVVSRDGALPPSLTPFVPRVVSRDLRAVASSDDVAVLYGDGFGGEVGRLQRLLGRGMPAVMVVSLSLDPRDVVEAFDNGVTSYLVVSEVPAFCVVDAAVRAAEGQSSLSPGAVVVLMSHMRQLSVVAAPEGEAAGEAAGSPGGLTPRECQIMELLVAGHTVAEIAGHLRLTNKTVRNNLTNIYAKLRVRRQSEAILLWLGHQHRPDAPQRYDEPRFVPRLSPLRQVSPQAL
jgi:DNA-binding NarL/FixJ family response regulator